MKNFKLIQRLLGAVFAIIGGLCLFEYWIFLIPVGEFYWDGFIARFSGMILFIIGLVLVLSSGNRKINP